MSSNENPLFLQTQHDAFARYIHSHLNTDERKKKKKDFLIAPVSADLRSEDRPAACGCRTSGPAGAQEETSLQRSQRWEMRGKQSGTDNEKEPEKLHILT